MTTTAFDTERLETLRAAFSGELLGPGGRGVRRGPARPQRPDREASGPDRALSGAADIAVAIRAATDAGVDISVRGGGHNVAGPGRARRRAHDRPLADEGRRVDAAAKTARARAARSGRVQRRDGRARPGHHRRRDLVDRSQARLGGGLG
jgi:hypothetical protein